MTGQTLFLSWQDKVKRRWYPIGRLDVQEPGYRFRYTGGAKDAEKTASFEPLPEFPEFERDYRANTLFPIFKNRIMTPSRPDFREYLQQLALSPAEKNPIVILSVSGGHRVTDEFQVFPKLEKESNGSFSCRFFVHGSSHVSPEAQERLMRLQSGEKLNVAIELTNPTDRFALQVQTEDYYMIGWTPRYLVDDLAHAMATTQGKFEAEVIKLNAQPAPSRLRLLVEFRGTLPENYEPMSAEQFVPLVK